MTEFIETIKGGDAMRVKAMIDGDRMLLDSKDANGVSAVLIALYHGQKDIARLLIESGAKLAFHDACAAGSVDQLRKMLREDPGLLDRRSVDGFPPVGLAIFFGNRDAAKFLIAEGADVNAVAENAQRVAPVHAASAVRDREILELLLDRGADPNARQQNDLTPLHTAASRGDREMAMLLLDRGADPAARSTDGQSVADIARKYKQEEFAEWFERRRPLGTRH